MHKKEMIKSNNEKRKELTEENREYYEDMLLYIRLSYSKSEQEMEEVLSEMLNHLLEAQRQGRSAEDVFGDDPKGYAEEIIGELPTMVTKERVSLVVTGLLALFAGTALFDGIGDLILSLTGVQSETQKTIHLGSFLVKTVSTVPLGFLFAYFLLQYIRWTSFSRVKRSVGFLRDFVFGGGLFILMGLFYLGIFNLLPAFGPEMQFPLYVTIISGIFLAALTWMSSKKI